jgi:pyruvate/oxaloacetate carboxyltransferase
MAADSLCIKDMAGILTPYDAYESLRMCALRLHRFHGLLQIAWVIHRIKDTKHIHSISNSTFDKDINHIVRIMAVTQKAGILTPYDAYELVSRLKKETNLEIQLHCHATAGLSSMTLLKAIEAGVDRVDTAISSLSMTYGHSPTESIVQDPHALVGFLSALHQTCLKRPALSAGFPYWSTCHPAPERPKSENQHRAAHLQILRTFYVYHGNRQQFLPEH